jgi:hypothetical protein
VGDAQPLADLAQRQGLLPREAEPQAQDLGVARRQGLQERLDALGVLRLLEVPSDTAPRDRSATRTAWRISAIVSALTSMEAAISSVEGGRSSARSSCADTRRYLAIRSIM